MRQASRTGFHKLFEEGGALIPNQILCGQPMAETGFPFGRGEGGLLSFHKDTGERVQALKIAPRVLV